MDKKHRDLKASLESTLAGRLTGLIMLIAGMKAGGRIQPDAAEQLMDYVAETRQDFAEQEDGRE